MTRSNIRQSATLCRMFVFALSPLLMAPVVPLSTALADESKPVEPELQIDKTAREELDADDPRLLKQDDDGTITFIWENDRFGGTDRNYTNGNRIS